MSRPSTTAQRNLSLTEELEKLEQSITLTLQEIDHNFSRAHRIVTTSILPVVENYRDHSNEVWEGSKFWKQFFEASANVSLSGYEEPPPDGSEVEGDESVNEDTATISPSAASAQATPSSASYASLPATRNGYNEDDMTPNNKQNQHYSNQDSPSLSQSTPRPQPRPRRTPKGPPGSKTPYTSPYERLKRATLGASPSESDVAPSTPRAQASPAKAAQSSPFAPPSTHRQTSHRSPSASNTDSNTNDVLLHRVLDKTWRIQATPHSTARLPFRGESSGTGDQSPARPSTARKAARRQAAERQQQTPRGVSGKVDAEDDFDSSPAAPAPELHAEIFDTPARKELTGRVGTGAARVPGVSVLTPKKWAGGGGGGGGGGRKPLTPAGDDRNAVDREERILWDSDDDDDDDGFGAGMKGMSPPKTMQFHVPQSRLVQTPAREASKRIVEDLLMTAGMRDGLDDDQEEEAPSPSIVKAGGLLEEDTF